MQWKKNDPFGYTDYRYHLYDLMKLNQLSFRSAAKHWGLIVSATGLAKLLKKKGAGFDDGYTISNEVYVRLLKQLRFSDREIQYLTILKIENDSKVLAVRHGSAFKNTMSKVRKQLQEQGAETVEKEQKADLVGQIMTLLPSEYQKKIELSCAKVLGIFLNRSRKDVDFQRLAILQKEFLKLTKSNDLRV